MLFYLSLVLAGGSGALLRYLLTTLTVNQQWTALPFGTLIANVLGSFLIGYLSWSLVHKWQVSKELQLVVLTGFLGGFTTFSAFSLEVIKLIDEGANSRAIVYILLSVLLSVGMCLLGLLAARHT